MTIVHDEIIGNCDEYAIVHQLLTQQNAISNQQLTKDNMSTEGMMSPEQWASTMLGAIPSGFGGTSANTASNTWTPTKQEAEDKALKRRVRDQLGKLLKVEFGLDVEQMAEERNRVISTAINKRINEAMDNAIIQDFIKHEITKAIQTRIGSDIPLAQHINNIRIEAGKAAAKAAEEFIANNISVRANAKVEQPGRKLHL